MRTNTMIAAAIVVLAIIAGAAYVALSNPAPAVRENNTEVQGWGLSGMVYDQDKAPIPGAVVTIYKAFRDNATGGWVNGEKLSVRELPGLPNGGNPQRTNDGSTAAPGSYMFSAVPEGTYNVTAEKDGHLWYAITRWGGASPNVDVAIPDYSYVPVAAAPAPGTLKPAPDQGPWATLTGTVTGDDGLPMPNATVTLWAVGYENGREANLGRAIVADDPRNNSSASANPVLSSDGSRAAAGTYVFYKAPWGLYNVTAEKDGKLWSAKVILGQGGAFGTAICNVGGVVWSPDRIEGFGTVTGIVTDQNKIGIPDANVTLWKAWWNATSGAWENLYPIQVKGNPQPSNNGSAGAVGMYAFYMVPWSAYNVTAEKDGHLWYSLLVLGPGDAYGNASYIPGSEYDTATHNIAIPDYDYKP